MQALTISEGDGSELLTVNALYNLEGAVAAWAQRGPYQMNESPRPRFSSELL